MALVLVVTEAPLQSLFCPFRVFHGVLVQTSILFFFRTVAGQHPGWLDVMCGVGIQTPNLGYPERPQALPAVIHRTSCNTGWARPEIHDFESPQSSISKGRSKNSLSMFCALLLPCCFLFMYPSRIRLSTTRIIVLADNINYSPYDLPGLKDNSQPQESIVP